MKNSVAVIVPGGVGEKKFIPSLVNLLSGLSQYHSLHIYTAFDADLHPLLRGQGVRCAFLPAIARNYKLLSLLLTLFSVLKEHRVHHFSAIHSFWFFPHGFLGAVVQQLTGIPFIVTLPGGDTVYLPEVRYGGMKSFIHRAVVRWGCRRASVVLLLSSYQEERAIGHHVRFGERHIIPYGVDCQVFEFNPKPIASPLRLVSIGSINRIKDVFLQIETYGLLRSSIDCRLTIVGQDILEGEVQAFAQTLKVAEHINWEGLQRHDDIPGVLHGADLLLLTSRYEAQAVVVMEAFAAGTVVVGTHVGLLADVDPDYEVSVREHTAACLVEKIIEVISHPDRFKALQEKNRLFAERHSIEWTVQEYEAVYSRVAGM